MRQKYNIVARAFDSHKRQIGIGFNSYKKTHPLQAYFARKVGHPLKQYLHAEMQALLRCQGHKVHTIVVERYGFNGEMRNSRPCAICMEAIKAFGVKQVSFTTNEGFKMERVT